MKKPPVIHSFLLAIFPVLFLFSHNLGEAFFLDIFIPIIITLIATFLIFMLLKFALKNSKKAGLITSVFLVLFFSYGHVYNFINGVTGFALSKILIPLAIVLSIALFLFLFLKRTIKEKKRLVLISSVFFIVLVLILIFSYDQIFNLVVKGSLLKKFFRFLMTHKFLSSVWIAVLVFVSHKTIKSKNSLNNLTKYLNNVLVILVVFSLLQIGYYYASADNKIDKVDNIQEEIIYAGELPDIYCIVLDEYGRADKLKELYGYDNSDFIGMLTDRGFYVASKSRSNYPTTFQSLPSLLNMRHINFLTEKLGKNSRDRRIPYQMIENNEVIKFLKARGYQFVHVSSGWDLTSSNKNADIEYTYTLANLNEFNQLIIGSTWSRVIILPWVIKEKYNQILYNFEKIGEVPNIRGPTFLFAHIVSPHFPYVFDQQGNFVSRDDYEMARKVNEQRQAYIDQLIFINKKTEELVDKILSRSEKPPIIIIMSDHGPESSGDKRYPTKEFLEERLANLNAFYLPNGGDKFLYDSITPVNTFRLIFDFYFNSSYGLLEDKSYFSRSGAYFDFVLIPDEDSIVWDILRERD